MDPVSKDVTRPAELKRFRDGEWEQITDVVVEEVPVTICLNDKELITLLCTPARLNHLAAGFLLSEGLIKEKSDILKLEVDENKGSVRVITAGGGPEQRLYGQRTVASGGGKGTVYYSAIDDLRKRDVKPIINEPGPEQVFSLMQELENRAELFRKTGGVHNCALAEKNGIIDFCEDIGRHNAVDKLLGKALLEEMPLQGVFLLSSGRVSSEILLKAAKAGLQMIISRAAPTALALELAEELGIKIIGFVRGRRMNSYIGLKDS